MKIIHCRRCGYAKFDSSHPCVNPDCDARKVINFGASKTRHVISATTSHGFHAPVVQKRWAV